MRTDNSIKNIIASTMTSMITILIGLFAQKIFVTTMGIEYLGINGLFTGIISMLGIAELGLGSAIIYHLYKPMDDRNEPRIKSLIQYYKKGYRLIAIIVATVGILIMPFLNIIVGKVSISLDIHVVFILFLIDVVCSYLLAYKQSILYADQQNRKINNVHAGYMVIMNGLQITALLLTGNYYLFLVVRIIMRIIENSVIATIVNKRYPFLNVGETAKIDKDTRADISKKIKALLAHKIGSFVVLGSDSIIISIFFGIKMVGLYTNYYLVIVALVNIISQLFTSITASVGNLLIDHNAKKSYDIYNKVHFANFWLASIAAIGFIVAADSFITLWLGNKYLLPFGVLLALGINLFLQLTRSATNSFKEAAGIFHEDRFVPIAESVVNIVSAVIFLHFFGLAGVFMGTICSNLVLHLFSYPKYVYTRLFERSYRYYYLEFIRYVVVAAIAGIITFSIARMAPINNIVLKFIFDVVLSIVLPSLFFGLLYRRTEAFIYYKNLLSNLFSKMKSRLGR